MNVLQKAISELESALGEMDDAARMHLLVGDNATFQSIREHLQAALKELKKI